MTDEKEYDVIIIGAGIAGLTSAALLTKSGLKVCVLERHYLIGGYIQGFQRKDFIFDTAIHWLNQCGENGTVSKLFNFIGDDYPRPQTMKTIKRHITDNHEFVLSNKPDQLKKELILSYPKDQKGIERFFKDAKKVADISLKFPSLFRSTETMTFWEKVRYGMKRASIGLPMIKHIFYSGEAGMKKGLGKYFTDPELLELFCAERDLLSCLFPVAWAYNNDFQNPPIGGSQVFAAWLNKKIETTNDSQVILNANVKEIVIEENSFKSVKYTKRNKSYELKGKYLIAACDVSKLYTSMLPGAQQNKDILKTLDKSEMYSSSVTVSIALDCTVEKLGFGHELVFISNDKSPRHAHSSGDPHTSAISVLAPTARDKTLAPEGLGTLTIYVPAWMDYKNTWGAKLNDKGEYERGEDYVKLKEEYASIVIDRVAKKMCPNLKKHILFQEVATPITYYRYSHNRDGSMMGTRPGKINMQNKVAHYKTHYDNVIIGGHWAELGGGVPIATKAAFNASLIVLKELNQKAFNELVNVMK